MEELRIWLTAQIQRRSAMTEQLDMEIQKLKATLKGKRQQRDIISGAALAFKDSLVELQKATESPKLPEDIDDPIDGIDKVDANDELRLSGIRPVCSSDFDPESDTPEDME